MPGLVQHTPSRFSEHEELRFPTQRPNEHVVLLLRRHWTIIAKDVIQLVLALCFLPILLAVLLLYSDFTLFPGTLSFVITIEVLSLYIIFAFLFYFDSFVDYHLDIWVVTDGRIVSIEQNGVFRRIVSELNILQMQDVTSEVNGWLQTFLDFGQVYIQTAGEKQRFVFEEVAHPSEVAKVILQVHDRAVKMRDIAQARDQLAYEQVYEQAQTQTQVPTAVPPMNVAEHQKTVEHRSRLHMLMHDNDAE